MKRMICLLLLVVGLPVFSSPIKLCCWIVAEDDGRTFHSPGLISNQVESVNRIYSQVAMSFSVESITFTNSTRLTNVVYTNSTQIAELCGLTNGTEGLEVYFVNSITDDTDGFQIPSGIVIGEITTDTVLAHEIGHACGLNDIYDFVDGMSVTGMPQKVYFTHDWGWYPENVTQAQIVQRLLMYGYDTETKGDISRGDVYGVWYEYEWNSRLNSYYKHWHLSNAPVGFKLHGNRHPVSE